MPPKKSSPAVAAPPATRAPAFREQVLEALDKAHRTTGNTAAVKKLLVGHSRQKIHDVTSVVAEITRTVFAQASSLAADGLKRHNHFLKEACDEIRTALNGCDDVSCAALEEVVAAGYAQDKTVRLAVAHSCAALIKTLNPNVNSDARMALYEQIALLLKHWMFDKCHFVREKALETITVFRAKDDLSTCDVTPLFLAVACEDTNPSTRRAAVTYALDKSTYFFDVARATRDASVKVRQAAWEVLGKFKLSHAAVYHQKYTEFLAVRGVAADQLPADFTARIGLGLQDESATVRKAAKLTLTHTWLHRELHNDVAAVLALLPYNKKYSHVVTQELYNHHCQRVADAANTAAAVPPQSSDAGAAAVDTAPTPQQQPLLRRGFPLQLTPLTVSGLLLWRVSCIDSTERASDDTDHVLLPIKTYGEILLDVVHTLCDTTGTHVPKVVELGENADPECVLDILLSLLPVYASAGYLAHTESAVRNQLIKQLSFILRVIPNADVASFVSDAVVGINALCVRDPTDGREAIATSIAKLSKFLFFVNEQSASFDDPVGYAKKDEARRLEHDRAAHRGGSPSEEDEARSGAMNLDKNFLHRMLKIVHEYLSQAQRGDPIPTICGHVTALGRSQTDDSVRAAAMRCLTLQCLINPEMVHTFLPLLLDATRDPFPGCAAAAMGAVFDVMCEFGLKFFNIGTSGGHDEQQQPPVAATTGSVDARRKLEQNIALLDVHKVGGARLVAHLLPFLRADVAPCRMVAAAGFCKLLAANRLEHAVATTVLADVLAASAGENRRVVSHLAAVVDNFTASYARSQPARLFRVAEAGILACRMLLATAHNGVSTAEHHATVAAFLARLVQVTDASLLRALQELDPEYTTRIRQGYAAEQAADAEDKDELPPQKAAAAAAAASSKGAAGGLRHATTGNARIQRELDANSVHEYLLLELLLECAAPGQTTAVQGLCLGVLRKLYLYRRDVAVTRAILSLGDRCLEALTLPEHREALKAFLGEYQRLVEAQNTAAAMSALGNPVAHEALQPLLFATYEERLAHRALQLADMAQRGYAAVSVIAATSTPRASAAAGGGGAAKSGRVKERSADTADDEAAPQPRRKASRRE